MKKNKLICTDEISGRKIYVGDAFRHARSLYVIEFSNREFGYIGVSPNDSHADSSGRYCDIRILIDKAEFLGNIFIDPSILNKKTIICSKCKKEYTDFFDNSFCPMCYFKEMMRNF